ncbi:hypothetical protein Nepgr_015913 [Nepenthes gracilis]|uniref:Uncharacterized protein n=1 Tax=Nepenthes gracilis TaxID=150966 RepID=A0AAD3SP36_NEPGR|nr:hypothetical protein Nepgr_015913 [Nepenthes gracilis]
MGGVGVEPSFSGDLVAPVELALEATRLEDPVAEFFAELELAVVEVVEAGGVIAELAQEAVASSFSIVLPEEFAGEAVVERVQEVDLLDSRNVGPSRQLELIG